MKRQIPIFQYIAVATTAAAASIDTAAFTRVACCRCSCICPRSSCLLARSLRTAETATAAAGCCCRRQRRTLPIDKLQEKRKEVRVPHTDARYPQTLTYASSHTHIQEKKAVQPFTRRAVHIWQRASYTNKR